MPESQISGAENVVGAFALALADLQREAVQEAAGLAGALPAALVSLHEFTDGRPVDVLAGALRVSHSRAVRVVDELEAAGLARRTRDPADGRATLVRLTAAGRRRGARVLAARNAVVERALAALTPAHRDALGRHAGRALAELAETRREASAVCRLCDVGACGHHEGRCPVTNGMDAREGVR